MNTIGYKEIAFTDHLFAEYLAGRVGRVEPIENFTIYHDKAGGKALAIVVYDNAKSTRRILIRTEDYNAYYRIV